MMKFNKTNIIFRSIVNVKMNQCQNISCSLLNQRLVEQKEELFLLNQTNQNLVEKNQQLELQEKLQLKD